MPGSFVDMISFNDQPRSRGLWRLSCSHAGALIPNYFPHIFPSLSVSSSVSVMCCIVHVPFVKGFLPSPKQLGGIFVLSLPELHTFKRREEVSLTCMILWRIFNNFSMNVNLSYSLALAASCSRTRSNWYSLPETTCKDIVWNLSDLCWKFRMDTFFSVNIEYLPALWSCWLWMLPPHQGLQSTD